jgi:bacterioferritin-associated ferredoxin
MRSTSFTEDKVLNTCVEAHKKNVVYCMCSNASFDSIIKKQRAHPLPFEEMLAQYTSCRQGCGSCIESLREYLKTSDLYFDE